MSEFMKGEFLCFFVLVIGRSLYLHSRKCHQATFWDGATLAVLLTEKRLANIGNFVMDLESDSYNCEGKNQCTNKLTHVSV